MSSLLHTIAGLASPQVVPKAGPPPGTPFAAAMQKIMMGHQQKAQQAHAHALRQRANAITADQDAARANFAAGKAQAQGAMQDNAGFDPMDAPGMPGTGPRATPGDAAC